MANDELATKMQPFEQLGTDRVLPGVYTVVRLDGRSFSRATEERWRFSKPFDPRFRDLMIATAKHLLQCGFQVVFAYTQSDEISLLLHRDDNTYGRTTRKILSVLSGEASATFSLALGDIACFDARISQLPTAALVEDYFRWRSADGYRNALNGHCYWLLRQQGADARAADAALRGKSVAEKNELLFQAGINFNDQPSWQKRGVGLSWTTVQFEGLNPITGQATTARRRQIEVDLNLPVGAAWSTWIQAQVQQASMPRKRTSECVDSSAESDFN